MADLNPALSLRVSASLAKDYRRRRVFPQLRIDGAEIEGAVTYRVERSVVEQVLADARIQYERPFTREEKGTKKSYGHLIDALRHAIEPESLAEEARQRVLDRAAAQFRVEVAALPTGLEVHRYGLRLLNAYGSSKQLVSAGYLPRDFDFPPEDDSDYKQWTNGGVDYLLTRRHQSGADKVARRSSSSAVARSIKASSRARFKQFAAPRLIPEKLVPLPAWRGSFLRDAP